MDDERQHTPYFWVIVIAVLAVIGLAIIAQPQTSSAPSAPTITSPVPHYVRYCMATSAPGCPVP
jgi:hypothetical protein